MKAQESSPSYPQIVQPSPACPAPLAARQRPKARRGTPSANPKSQKLASLKAQAASAWQAALDADEPMFSDGPHRKKWHKLNKQIGKLEETFVVYAGRDVDSVAVAYQSGDITINESLFIEAEERLHRSADGTYYLYRERRHREYVHRLTLKAAVLWAVTRANIYAPGLRRDVNLVLGQR